MHELLIPFQRSCFFALVLISLISGEKICIAQASHQIFEHLTTDQGLSSDKVEAVLQDREGFYWIATQNGLNRYDGTTFRVYRHHSNDSTWLTNNNCTALLEGQNGDIWISTYRGLSRFSKATGCFQQIYLTHPTKNFEITNRIYSLAIDNNGDVWIAGNGLWKYHVQTDSIAFFQHNPSDPASVTPYGLITQMVYDSIHHGLWFSTRGNLNFFSTTHNQFYHHLNNPFQWKVFEVADGAEITLDRKNHLWFRDMNTQSLSYFEVDKNLITPTGKKISYGIKKICADEFNRIWIFYYLARSEIFDPETAYTDVDFFSMHHRLSMLSEQGNSLFIDKQKNYWIASGKGISIYNQDNQYYRLYQMAVQDKGLEEEAFRIHALAQTEPLSVWIGSNLGLFKYDLNTGDYQQILENELIHNIKALYPDGDKLWIGSDDHLLCMDARSRRVLNRIILNSDIFFIRKGRQEELWVGSWVNGLYRIHTQTENVEVFRKDGNDPSSIKTNALITGLFDGDNFWIGYNGGNGFSKNVPFSKAFIHYHPHEKDISSSSAGTITAIAHDRADHISIGTHGSGIFLCDTATASCENYQQQQGLNSNFINSIIPDASGNLWISTADGMNYFQMSDHTIHRLDVDLVFPDNDVEPNGIDGLNGRMYFYCKNEFVEVNPSAYLPDTTFPHVVISSFRIFDKEVPLSGQQNMINLSHRENFFSFTYSMIRTDPLKEVKYAYKLEGFDKDWNIADQQQYAGYTNVPGGNYRFKVKATNDEGKWSGELLSLPVHVKPPFWRTWWFYGLCVVFILGSIYTVYQYRIRQLRRVFMIKSKISQDLHDDVGASLSSIHIYSSVAEKAIHDDPQKAAKIIEQIKQNSRQVIEDMSDIIWAMNADRGEGESLVGRIKNYGQDLLSQMSIDCGYRIDPLVERKLQQPHVRKNVLLILKEALNNIAKYSGATQAEVVITVDDKCIHIRISDNGKGFDPATVNWGNGINNMKQRTDQLEGIFSLHASEERGTHIHCCIPI